MTMNETTKIADTKLTARTKAAIKEHFPYAVTLGDLKQCISDDPKALDCFTPHTVDIIMNILDFTDYDGVPAEPPAVQETAPRTEIMTDSAKYAYTVHAQIVLGAKMVEDGLYQMAKGFKIMRDEKLYKELGYDTFEKYCEVETGIKRRQVYNYISIAEKLPADFVQSTAQIGSEKLKLLTALTDEQREEIAENTDLENTTVKELKRQIDELTGKNKSLAEDIKNLKINNARLENENLDLSAESFDLEEERDKLLAELKEARSEAREVIMTDPKTSEEYRSLKDDYDKIARQIIATTQERDRLKERCDELYHQTQEAPVYVGSVDIDEIEKFVNELAGSIDAAIITFFRFFKEEYPEEVRDIFRRKADYIKTRIDNLAIMYLDDDD